jgi:hypothetical protein
VKRLVLWTASAVVSCSSLALVVGSTPLAAAPAPALSAAFGGTLLLAPGHTRIHAAPGISSTNSSNWSGYVQLATTKHSFTEVSDTMVVPAVTATPTGTQYAADWVGIGGDKLHDNTLIQDGIQTVVTTTKSKSTTSYDAWTEILPQAEKPLDGLTLNVGDSVTSSVTEIARNRWIMTVDDTTTDQSQSRTVTYRSKGLSVEAIHERPCVAGNCQSENDLATLAQTTDVDFGPGSFSETSPQTTPVTLPLLKPVAGASMTEIVMVENAGNTNTVLATPSAPDGDQDAFAVADGPDAPQPPTP